ncbi:MAG: oligosaccharide flippase family protein [Clostridium sp.]|nr:oligosaccharide flippase family protein [Clostridium sp.]
MSKSIGKNIIFKLILNLFNIIIPILIGPYVYRKLGDTLNGYINFTDSIYQYFFIFASFGIYQYGIREISRVRDDREKLERAFTSLFSITVVTNLLSTIGYVLFVNYRYSDEVFYSTCLITAFNFLANAFYVEWVNEGLENYDFITIKTIAIRAIYTVCIFIFLKSADNYMDYLVIMVISNILNNLISFIYVKSKIKFRFDKIQIKRHIKPMFLVVILSNANVLYTQLDRVMLGEFVNMQSVSYYGLAQRIVTIVSTFMLTVVHVSIPRLSNYLSKEKDEDYLSLLNRITSMYFLIVFPAAIGMSCLSYEIVAIYGGAEFISAASVLGVFAIYMITIAYENIISNQVLYIRGEEKTQVKIVFVAGIINLVLNIILVQLKYFTATTAIITTTFANALLVIGEYLYVRFKLKLEINLFSISKLKYLFISLLFIPIIYLIKYLISNLVIYTLVSMGVCSILYFGILIILKDETFNYLKDIVLSKVKALIDR